VLAQHLERGLGKEGQLVGDLLAVVPAQLAGSTVHGVLFERLTRIYEIISCVSNVKLKVFDSKEASP